MSKTIKLTQGFEAIVDDEDYKYLSEGSWCIQKYVTLNNTGIMYAKASKQGKVVTMHRYLLKPPQGVSIDHINGNGLDNRRQNLRLCSKQGNAANRPKDRIKGATSKFKGVYKPKKYNKWISKITVDGKSIHLGVFEDEVAAAKAYDSAALKYFGTFAKKNVYV